MSHLWIGITGGIGSGKSEITAYLRKRGEYVLCADEVAREVVQPGEKGAEAVRAAFGDGYFLVDGTLDRAKLAQHVFGNPERVKRLNAILHPVIIDTIWKRASHVQGRVFIDAPLLIESGMHERTDYLWVVTANKEVRLSRVMERDGATREAVEKRMENQIDDEMRIMVADEVIDNSRGFSELHEQIDRLLQKDEYNEV